MKVSQIKKLEEETNDVNFWNNREKAEQIIKEINNLKNIVSPLKGLKCSINTDLELLELLNNSFDEEILVNIETDIISFSKT